MLEPRYHPEEIGMLRDCLTERPNMDRLRDAADEVARRALKMDRASVGTLFVQLSRCFEDKWAFLLCGMVTGAMWRLSNEAD